MSKPRKTPGVPSSKARGKTGRREKEIIISYQNDDEGRDIEERNDDQIVHGTKSQNPMPTSTKREPFEKALRSNKKFMVRHKSAMKKLANL